MADAWFCELIRDADESDYSDYSLCIDHRQSGRSYSLDSQGINSCHLQILPKFELAIPDTTVSTCLSLTSYRWPSFRLPA